MNHLGRVAEQERAGGNALGDDRAGADRGPPTDPNTGDHHRAGTDEDALFSVLLKSPPEHLKQVNYKYVDRTGYSITKSLEDELSGHAKDAAIHLVNMKLKPIDTAVQLIEKSMKGMGTKEYHLTAAILRYQSLLHEILPVYEDKYGERLEDRIKSELSGDFEKLIVRMIDYKPKI